eukprot:8340000-Heterocapsa_arctica.AAC.1
MDIVLSCCGQLCFAGLQCAVSKILLSLQSANVYRHKQTISETTECMALEPLSVAEQHMLAH